MYWIILSILSAVVCIIPLIWTGRISQKLTVRKKWWLLLSAGWLIFGLAFFALGTSIILLFVEDTHQVTAFIAAPISIMLLILMLDQYLPIVYSYRQSDIEDTIKFCVKLFKAANKSIKIISGFLSSSFYSDQRIIDALKDATRRNVSVEIVFQFTGSEIQQRVIEGLSFLNLRVSLFPIAERITGPHGINVDNVHVRTEKNHHLIGQSFENTPIGNVENVVHFWSPLAAWGFNRRFAEFKKAPQVAQVFSTSTKRDE